MDTFQGRVAVITGATSGIGRSLAWKCAQEGMKVVLVSANQARVEQAARDLRIEIPEAEAIPVQADVSRPEDVERLAQQTWEAYGATHLLINNAGIVLMGTPLDLTLEEWHWIMGVNFWGVLHGIRAFVPRMLSQGEEGHVVNISSAAGLLPGGWTAPYYASKHAMFALTESLFYRLAETRINVSVVLPGFVRTNLMDADRNRPAGVKAAWIPPHQQRWVEAARDYVDQGMNPDDHAELVFEGVRRNLLYILTHPEVKEEIREWIENILNERNLPLGG